MSEIVSRRTLLRAGALTAGAGTLGLGACSRPETDALTWSMWSSSAAENQVWADFSSYVERTLGRPSVPTLSPSGGYPTKLDLQLVSGTASMVTAINGTLIPTYAARGALRPLDDLIAGDPDFDLDDFYPASRRISSFDDTTYAIGFDVAPTVLYVNTTLFDQNGIDLPSATEPLSWSAFHELAAAFSSRPGQHGFTCAPSIDDLVSWLYCSGGNVMNATATASALSSPESMAALELVVDLFVRDAITPPIANLVTESALANFLKGNVAMMQNGPWQVVNARKADFAWDVIPFPAGPVGSTPRVSGSSFGIPAGTRDVEQAWRLLTTLTSTGALDIYARAGRNNPARSSAGTAFTPPPANLGIVQKILAGRLAGGHPYDVTTNWNEVRNLLGQYLGPVFLGQTTIRDALAQVEPQLDVLFDQHQQNLRQSR